MMMNFYKASELLSQITHLAAVMMLPRSRQPVLQHLEFISLSNKRVLVIIVHDHKVQNRIIHTACTYTSSELQQALNYLNEMFFGKALDRIRELLLDELEKMKDNVNQIMQSAIELAQTALTQRESEDDKYVVAGQTNLMDVEEPCDLDRLKGCLNVSIKDVTFCTS